MSARRDLVVAGAGVAARGAGRALTELVPCVTLAARPGVGLWLGACRRRGSAGTAPVATRDCGYVDGGSPRRRDRGSSLAGCSVCRRRSTVRERVEAPGLLAPFAPPRGLASQPREPLLHGVRWPFARRLADRGSRLRFLQRGKRQICPCHIPIVLLVLLAWSTLA